MLRSAAPQLVPASLRRDTPWPVDCVTADGTSSRHSSHALGDHLQFDVYGSKRLRALPRIRYTAKT